MKILMLDKYLETGGVATFLKTLSSRLIREGHSVYLLTGADKSNEKIIDEFQSVGIHVLTVSYSGNRIVTLFRFLKAIFRLMREIKINIMHSQHRLTHFAALIVGKIKRIPRLLTLHVFKKDHKMLMKLWMNEAITVPSRALKKRLINYYGLKEEQIHVIYNSISPQFEPNERLVTFMKKTTFFNTDAFYVTYIGRLSPEKGVDTLVKSISMVTKHHTDIAFRIFGDGPERQNLKQQSTELDLDPDLIFQGKNSHVNELLSLTNVCVLPSRSENFSLFALESLRAGRPVIATNVGGNPEVIEDGETGLLVESNYPEALAEAILELYNNESARKELAKKARQRFEKQFSIEEFYRSYFSSYRRLVS